GQPQHHELAFASSAAAMREPQEVKGVWLALSPAASVVSGEAPEFDQPRLLGVQLQTELAQPVSHRSLEAFGIIAELAPHAPIAGIPPRDHVAPGMALPPLLDPQIERVVQVDVG